MQKKWVLASSIGALVVAIAIVAFVLFGQNNKVIKNITKRIAGGGSKAFCKIDGLPADEDNIDRKPLAVMIENYSTIRPQSGLSEACIVFEALAEGGITRFVAIFNHNDVKSIGPVRSARPYYVAVVKGFDAVYAHAGGSKVGLQKVREYDVDDLDQFRYSAAYWRQSGKKAPHNLFTSTEKLRKESEKAGFNDIAYDSFKMTKKKLKGKKAENIKIEFSSAAYEVKYKYDPKSKKYKRFNGGIKHTDANNSKQITPGNIIVLRADTSTLEGETLNIDIIGEGNGYLFRNGNFIDIKWRKEAADTQISITDEQDKEVKLAAGQIWVEIVEPETKVIAN